MMTFMILEEIARKVFQAKRCLSLSQLEDLGVISVKCGTFNWQASTAIDDGDVLEDRVSKV